MIAPLPSDQVGQERGDGDEGGGQVALHDLAPVAQGLGVGGDRCPVATGKGDQDVDEAQLGEDVVTGRLDGRVIGAIGGHRNGAVPLGVDGLGHPIGGRCVAPDHGHGRTLARQSGRGSCPDPAEPPVTTATLPARSAQHPSPVVVATLAMSSPPVARCLVC